MLLNMPSIMDEKIIDKLWSLSERIPFDSKFLIHINRNQKINPLNIFNYEKYYLELGPGWGEVSIEMANQNKDVGFILIEKKINRVQHILKEINKYNLNNIRIVLLNFNWFLKEILQEDSYHEILLNFPDPWPKERHRKHRSFDIKFANDILCLLKNGGRFRFATDHGGYGRSVIRMLRKSQIESLQSFHYSLNRPNLPFSYFEKIKLSENKKIYYIEIRKK